MDRFTNIVARHPAAALLTAVIVALALGSQISTLRADVSPTAFMIADDPEKPVYDAAKQAFGSDNATMVVVKAGDIFAPESLAVLALMLVAVFRSPVVVLVSAAARVVTIIWALGLTAILDVRIGMATVGVKLQTHEPAVREVGKQLVTP